LGVVFTLVSLPFVIATVYAADKMAIWLKNNPKIMRFIDYSFAVVFSMFAVRIIFTQGR
jgi:threonine/homoserine/homoserine lactone efflux protein